MTEHICTQEEGVILFNSAGFTIDLFKDAFFIIEGDTKVQFTTDISILESPTKIMNILFRIWRDRGIRIGEQGISNQIKIILGL